MNTFKKNGGFTLVELIIVIAILAILSAVAVAGYSTYITKANTSAVNSELGNISTAATLANAQAGEITGIEVTYANKTFTIKITAGAFAEKFEEEFVAVTGATPVANEDYTYTLTTNANWGSSDYKNMKATWNNNEWKAVANS